jgi:multiple sugar transport system permease protein
MSAPQVSAPGTTPAAVSRGRIRAYRLTGLWFVLPFLLAFAFVFLAPIVWALVLSLFQTRLIGGTSFVGLANFAAVLQDQAFWQGFGRVALFLVVQVPIMLSLSTIAAMVLDAARVRGIRFYRIVIFLPYAVPGVAASLIWGFMYGERFGLAGNINDLVGFTLITPLSAEWLLASIGNIVTWLFVGYNMLIIYSALKGIPTELYEAAELDGAGPLRVARSIKLPAIRGALVIAFIFSIIGSFQLFNEPSVLRTIVPNLISTSYTPNLYAYNLSFVGQQASYAAALSIVMGVITAVIAYVVQFRANREALR